MNTNYEMKLILLFMKLCKLNFCLLCMTLFVTISLPRKNKVNNFHKYFTLENKCCPRLQAEGSIFKPEVTVFHYTDRP